MEGKKKGVGGKLALHILAFVGVTVLLLAIALVAAIWIATKGPSETARDNVVEWADSRGLGFAAGLFLSAEEENAILNPSSEEPQTGDTEDEAFIVVASDAPETSNEPESQPEESPAASPETSPEASPAETDGEEAA